MVDNGKSDETKFPSGREEKYRLVFHFYFFFALLNWMLDEQANSFPRVKKIRFTEN